VTEAQQGSPEPPEVPRRVPWGVPEALALLACGLALQTVAAILVGAGEDDLAGQLAAATAANALLLALVWGLVRHWSGGVPVGRLLGFRRAGWGRMLRGWRVLAAGALAYVGIALAVGVALYAMGTDWEQVPAQPLVRMIGGAESPRLLAFACVVAVLVAPVAEEVVFRSLLYLPLRARLGVIPAALIISAAFAAVHFYPWGVANLVVLSLTFVALFERTGTLWAPIAAHAAYNGLIIVVIRGLGLPR